MRLATPCLMLAALLITAALRAESLSKSDAPEADNTVSVDTPYASIVARNMFGLLPIPPPDTNPPAPPVDPPPKITLNGIMTIFGRDQALFKVVPKSKPGQPPKEDAYVMAEGEMQNDITVQKINHVDGIVTFDNHGTIQELTLAAAANGSEPAAGGGGGGGGNPAFPGRTAPMSGADRLNAMHAQNAVRANAYSGTPNAGAMNSPGMGSPGIAGNSGGTGGLNVGGSEVNEKGIYQPHVDEMTPEQNVILIEAQRMQMLQQGNPMANVLPPTPLTKQNLQENGGGMQQ